MKTSSKIAILVASIILTVVGTSCHTVNGVGHDVRDVGSGIQRAAN